MYTFHKKQIEIRYRYSPFPDPHFTGPRNNEVCYVLFRNHFTKNCTSPISADYCRLGSFIVSKLNLGWLLGKSEAIWMPRQGCRSGICFTLQTSWRRLTEGKIYTRFSTMWRTLWINPRLFFHSYDFPFYLALHFIIPVKYGINWNPEFHCTIWQSIMLVSVYLSENDGFCCDSLMTRWHTLLVLQIDFLPKFLGIFHVRWIILLHTRIALCKVRLNPQRSDWNEHRKTCTMHDDEFAENNPQLRTIDSQCIKCNEHYSSRVERVTKVKFFIPWYSICAVDERKICTCVFLQISSQSDFHCASCTWWFLSIVIHTEMTTDFAIHSKNSGLSRNMERHQLWQISPSVPFKINCSCPKWHGKIFKFIVRNTK